MKAAGRCARRHRGRSRGGERGSVRRLLLRGDDLADGADDLLDGLLVQFALLEAKFASTLRLLYRTTVMSASLATLSREQQGQPRYHLTAPAERGIATL